jgi:hypothetical protein
MPPMIRPLAKFVLGLCLGSIWAPPAADAPGGKERVCTTAPDRVEVLPVFFVAADAAAPGDELRSLVRRHLDWSQKRFGEMLGGRDTFALSDRPAPIVRGAKPLSYYRERPEGGAPEMVAETFEHFGVDRFSCPYVFALIVMNEHDDWPPGGGRPFNGGFNTGGGFLVLSSFLVMAGKNAQSTLQHELGHSFGLPHVDTYGYDMGSSLSIMSYNEALHTRGFEPGDQVATLIPEDVRGLAYNDRVFAHLAFDARRDVPDGYALAAPVWLGPMWIPGQPDCVVRCTTRSGEEFSTCAQNAVQGRIVPNSGPGVTFDARTMWQSGETETGWVELEVTFPFEVGLDSISISTEHSGRYHRARAVAIEAWVGEGWSPVVAADLDAADSRVSFKRTAAERWRVRLRAGESRIVTVRGLRFFDGPCEVFGPLVPE